MIAFSEFYNLPIMGILRGMKEEQTEELMECIYSAGLRTIEITMNTNSASKIIKKAKQIVGNQLIIGAGTVLSEKELESALEAGAQFIVMPTFIPDVVQRCQSMKIPVFPGALTPQEIYNAWNAGATMVKLFPAKFFGPQYIQEIKGPFQEIPLMVCGGVGPESVGEFFKYGATAAAFGGSVFKREWLEAKEYGQIEQGIQRIIKGYEAFKREKEG